MSGGDENEPPFSISHVFNASREKVWKAWTEHEHLLRWFGPKGIDDRVHSTWTFASEACSTIA